MSEREWVPEPPETRLATYTVTAERDGKFWLLRVKELPNVFTQVRRLDQAEAWIRDAIAVMLETSEDSFEVHIEPVLDDDLERLVLMSQFLRGRAQQFVHGSNTYLGGTVRRLVRDEGLTVRDVGGLLGLSFQRVQQLAAEERVGVNLAEIERDLGVTDAELTPAS